MNRYKAKVICLKCVRCHHGCHRDIKMSTVEPFYSRAWLHCKLLFSRKVVSNLFVTQRTAAYQASLSFTIFWSLLKLLSIESVMPSNHLILCHPFSSCPQSFPASGSFQWVGSLHQVAKVLELQLQHQRPKFWSFSFSISPSIEYSWLISLRIDWSPCCPRDSQESLPAPQFESISSPMLSLLYGSTVTSIHDCWKNHSFDYTDFCSQSHVSAF